MRVLILANGDPPSAELARSAARSHDLIVATDGAAHRAAGLGIAPALICGDFDSIDMELAVREFPGAEFVETPNQDLADVEKALLLACDRGATAVTVLGAGGGRIDHALASAALLLRHHGAVELALRHDGATVRALSAQAEPGRLDLSTRPGDTISLIAFSAENRVSLSGVAWPLDNQPLTVGTHGVSNVAMGERVTALVHVGAVLICHLFTETSL
jgi:thiamine pyrophosphokinase